MAADYLVSSLAPLSFDGPAPYTRERFDDMCREQLGEHPFAALEPRWNDLVAQLRNVMAAERAQARNQDPAPWQHAVTGCDLSWRNRISAAFQEKDPAKRDRLLDRVLWDAAGEMTPPSAPLSRGAAFTYKIRLDIVIKRSAISAAAGNAVFDKLTAASKLSL